MSTVADEDLLSKPLNQGGVPPFFEPAPMRVQVGFVVDPRHPSEWRP